jgi:hypothetical protein
MSPAAKTRTRNCPWLSWRLMKKAMGAAMKAHATTAAGPSPGMSRETLTEIASAKRASRAFIFLYPRGRPFGTDRRGLRGGGRPRLRPPASPGAPPVLQIVGQVGPRFVINQEAVFLAELLDGFGRDTRD